MSISAGSERSPGHRRSSSAGEVEGMFSEAGRASPLGAGVEAIASSTYCTSVSAPTTPPPPSPSPLPRPSTPSSPQTTSVPAPSPDHALALFRSIRSNSVIDCCLAPALHALAKSLSLARRLFELHQLLIDLNGGIFPSALPPSPMDHLRWLAAASNLPFTLSTWSSLRSSAASSGPSKLHLYHNQNYFVIDFLRVLAVHRAPSTARQRSGTDTASRSRP